jgi:hypothetical protein
VLDVVEQALAVLLDEHPAERVAEEPDVAAHSFHRSSVARSRLQNRTIAW